MLLLPCIQFRKSVLAMVSNNTETMCVKKLLLFFLLLMRLVASAQCPSGKNLWDAVEVSRNDEKKSIRQLLSHMLELNQQAVKCHVASDSGLVSMHQRIAALYFNIDSVQSALT